MILQGEGSYCRVWVVIMGQCSEWWGTFLSGPTEPVGDTGCWGFVIFLLFPYVAVEWSRLCYYYCYGNYCALFLRCYLLLLNIYFEDLDFSWVMLLAWTPHSTRGQLGAQQKKQGRMQLSSPKLCRVKRGGVLNLCVVSFYWFYVCGIFVMLLGTTDTRNADKHDNLARA
jgi:hypothetical protein